MDRAYQIRMEILLKEWEVRIQELRDKADLLEADRKTRYMAALEDLAEKKQMLQRQLESLKKTGSVGWAKTQSALDEMVGEMDRSFREALAFYK